MKAKYNKSEIMKEAHSIYAYAKYYGWSFSESLKEAWSKAKVAFSFTKVEECVEVDYSELESNVKSYLKSGDFVITRDLVRYKILNMNKSFQEVYQAVSSL